jgi:hypothetical protein
LSHGSPPPRRSRVHRQLGRPGPGCDRGGAPGPW